MNASTNTLVALSEFGPEPSVSRCNDTPKDRRSTEACAGKMPGAVPSVDRVSSTPLTETVTSAWAVKMPATAELIVTKQSPKAFVPAVQSDASTVAGAPPGKVITGIAPAIGSNVEPSRLSSTPK